MNISDKTLNQTIARNLIERLGRAHLRESDLPDVSHISAQDANTVLAGGGASSQTLYRLAQTFNCAVDDFYLGIYDDREAHRNGGNVNGDRLKVINSLQNHELLKQLADISNQELRDSIYSVVTGFAGMFRYLDMEGLQLRRTTED